MKFVLLLVLVGSISCTFREHAKRMYIGTALLTYTLNSDADYKKYAGEQFNMMTPGNEMKIDATEPQQGKFNYAAGDTLVNFAQQHNMKTRGHTLVWHSQVPNWMSALKGTNLLNAMKNHITNVVGHFKGKIYAWDVCNEVFAEDGNLRNSFWLSAGNDFIATAFRTAHAADSNAKLYINDYNTDGINAKSTGLYNYVKKLLSQGVPIHGVGIQSHLGLGQISNTYEANLKRFAELGLDVAITELDIGLNGQSEQAQATAYSNVITACANVSRCVGVTIWGISDRDSWRASSTPLPWDRNYRAKPAVAAIEKALK